MRLRFLSYAAALAVVLVGAAAANAEVVQKRTVGPFRVELHVLPAEPFFSKQDVADKQIKQGMEIEGGAAPVPPDADSHPNHHLVVHIFRKRSDTAVTDATVTMSFVPVDAKGKPTGAAVEVPVVIMQAIGGGAASTHYGNNVVMPPGRYQVTVGVNDKRLVFTVAATDAPMGHMDHMKM